MKKALFAMILAVLIAGCSLEFHDQDGFRLFNFSDIDPQSYVIQSHDGFKIGDQLYNEEIRKGPVTVENVLPREIDVRIWHNFQTKWVKIQALGSLTLGEIK
jgi:hypothetical protein